MKVTQITVCILDDIYCSTLEVLNLNTRAYSVAVSAYTL